MLAFNLPQPFSFTWARIGYAKGADRKVKCDIIYVEVKCECEKLNLYFRFLNSFLYE